MPGFDVVRCTSLPAAEAWRRVTAWERHGEFVPVTRVTVHHDDTTGRETFVARTGIGPVAFDDVMAVTHCSPPTETDEGLVRIVKQGRVVLGWAVLTVTPLASGSEVHWHEEARLRWTRGPLVTLVDKVVARGFGRLLDGLLAT